VWQPPSQGRRFPRRYAWQLQHLAAYLETLEPDERLVLVIGVNYMDRANQVRRKEGITSCLSKLLACREFLHSCGGTPAGATYGKRNKAGKKADDSR